MSQDSDGDFTEYVSARLERLHRTAYFMCGDTHTADDVVQATLLSPYGRWRHARSADNLDGYVYRIMTRRFLDLRRSRWSRVLGIGVNTSGWVVTSLPTASVLVDGVKLALPAVVAGGVAKAKAVADDGTVFGDSYDGDDSVPVRWQC